MILKNIYFRVNLRFSRIVIIAAICLVFIFSVIYTSSLNVDEKVKESVQQHNNIVHQYYRSRKVWKLSKLGEVLYKNEQYPICTQRKNKTFTIWKAHQKPGSFLSKCSVNNCIFTGDENKLKSADAVIVHLQSGIIPSIENRNPNQRWLFLNDESPHHVFGLAKRKIELSDLHNVFNWSLTYRHDAEVPVPYGRTVALKTPKIMPSDFLSVASLVPNWKDKKRNVLVAILISNCGVPYRNSIIKTLKQFIAVDVRGKCGDIKFRNSCPGYFRRNCEVMDQYLFYLALENSKCKEYVTEKLFYNAYLKGAIPIIQGPTVEECQQFLPPNSYLHVDNYATLKDLADDVEKISKNEKELLQYHVWRNHFEVVNEHGYFGLNPLRLCRVCEAMNCNEDTQSVYSEQKLREFLDPAKLCRD